MARAMSTISTFSSGELDPRMRGRTDLKHYLQGALRMRNFRQLAQGGVATRPGSDLISRLQGDGRLIPFIFSEEQSYLLAFTPNRISIFASPSWEKVDELETPYSLSQIKTLDFTQFADTMIICHEDVPIRKLERLTASEFFMSLVTFDKNEDETRIHQPYHKFTRPEIHIKFSHPQGTYTAGTSVAAGFYTQNSTTPQTGIWNDDHIGKRFQIIDTGDSNKFKEFEVTALASNGYDATVTLKDGISTQAAALTLDWAEPLFSDLRGYPSTTCFREGRLWFNGPPARPSGLVASKIEQFFNFDVGTAADDDAIDFNCATSEVRKIEYLVPGRDLTVLTDGAEMYISVDEGEAITPSNINVRPQTFFGCKRVKPYVFDNAILFAQRGNGRNIREYFYKDLNQAYTSSSISILAGHLVQTPIDAAVLTSSNFAEQYAFFVMENGSMAVFHSIREEETRGWSLWFPGTSDAGQDSATTTYNNSTITFASESVFMSQTDLFSSMTVGDKYLSVACVNDDLFVITQRKIAGTSEYFVERFNTDRYFDLGMTRKTSSGASRTFSGLTTYSNHKVAVRVRNAFIGMFDVSPLGVLTLPDTIEPQVSVEVGLPFLAYLKPMPFDASTRAGQLSGRKRRLSRLIVETFDTLSLTAEQEVLLTRNVQEDLSGQPTARSGPYEFNFLGYSREPTVTLLLTEPMKATILSMQAELAY
tara:strand:- start:7430 stop:9544 length:2115 start_codon:yes stop_codon:yes gene_type:complete